MAVAPEPETPPPAPRPSREMLTFLGGWLVPFGVVVSLEFGQRAGLWATLAALVWGLARHERHADHAER